MKLEFDAKTHTYKYENQVLPSVTQILTDAGIIKPEVYKPGAAQKGTDAHDTLSLVDHEIITPDCVREEFKAQTQAWEEFKKNMKVKILENEIQVFSKLLRYAGTIDRIVEVADQLVILDIKTGVKEKWHALQLTAYLTAYTEMNSSKSSITLMDVYLPKEDGYKVQVIQPEQAVWTACVQIYRWKQK